MPEHPDGWDPDYLKRRIAFLQARASAHLDNPGEDRAPRLSLAGGLLREAGATAILAGQHPEARRLLAEAGRTWMKLGLFSGFALLGLAQGETPWSADDLAHVKDLLEPVYPIADLPPAKAQGPEPLDAEVPEETFDEGAASADEDALAAGVHPGPRRSRGGEAARPYFEASARSVLQVLHLYQSLLASSRKGGLEAEVAALARERLGVAGEAPIGPAGLPLSAYVELLDQTALKGALSDTARNALQELVLRRELQIRAAQADVHHWRMARQAPAIVDLDFAALIVSVIDCGRSDQLFASELSDRGAVVALPLEAARAMRGPTHQFGAR